MIRRSAALLLVALLPAATGCAPVIIGAAGVAGTAAAEERGLSGAVDDTRIRAEINHLWFQHDVEMYTKLDMTVNEGKVLLTGVVPTPQAGVDAVRLAWQAAGVRQVMNEIQVSDKTSLIDYGRDVLAANTLRTKLLFDKNVKNVNYTVETVNGIVYLMGVAQDQAEMDRVLSHARSVTNVRKVVNYVLLKNDPRRHS